MHAAIKIWCTLSVCLFVLFTLTSCGDGGGQAPTALSSGNGEAALVVPLRGDSPPGATPMAGAVLPTGFLNPLGDFVGPPPVDDPSALGPPLIGPQFAEERLAALPPPMEGALEGGTTGTIAEAGINNVIPEDQLQNGVNVPTGGPPSPLFGAEPFTQTMLRTEEFGTEPTEPGFSGDGTLEIWTIKNGGQGWSHPVHVHFEEGIILKRGGREPPEWEKWARKDIYRIGPEAEATASVEMAMHIREFHGTYMEHCHNTQHEDHSMLLRWDSEHPGQFQLMPTPLPTWDGVEYVDSAALPTFRSGDGVGP